MAAYARIHVSCKCFSVAVEVLDFMIQVQLADHLRAKSGVVNTASRASSSVHVGQRISLF